MSDRIITEKENALRVYNRTQAPEWIPVSPDSHLIVIPSVVRERPVRGADGPDWFGCNWVWDSDCLGFAPDVRNPPLLDDISRWREVVKFPNLDAIDWQTAAANDLKGVDRNEVLIRVIVESGPFERTHHLLGFQEAFLAMSEEPEEYKALIDAVAEYKVDLLNKICQYYKPDNLFPHDDLGSAQGPMMSIAMYRELLKPAHKKIVEAIRSHDVICTHHSCGKMEAFIDDLIDIGVQAINPVQPMNDFKEIARKYSSALVFDVGGDTSANYQDASEEAIRQDVMDVIDCFGPQNNLIVSCFPKNAKCLSNYDIVLDEARRYGFAFCQRPLI